MLSAIVIVGPEMRTEEGRRTPNGETAAKLPPQARQIRQETPLALMEVLGRSVAGWVIEELRRAGVEMVSIFGRAPGVPACDPLDSADRFEFCSVEEAWCGATKQLRLHRETGVDATLVVRVGVYVDLDLKDALQFHREEARAVTRAFQKSGEPLDLWIIDPAQIAEGADIVRILTAPRPARYQVGGYVNQLKHPRDLRQLVVDALACRCWFRPQGSEIRPGLWMDEGAQVHRDARIVAPAFIGRGARIAQQCLITRSSNVESNCLVDYGTVVEDSSILSNTYVGIGLDLSHSIVDGNHLVNLERNVTLEIADSCVIRDNRVPHQESRIPVASGSGAVQFAPAEDGSHSM